METHHITWCKHQPTGQERPHQWYLHDEPCRVISVGIENGKVSRILVKCDGELSEIMGDENGFPGLTYEVMDG